MKGVACDHTSSHSHTKIRKTKVTEGVSGRGRGGGGGVSGHAADFQLFNNLSLDYSHGEHEGGVGVRVGVWNYHNLDQLQKVRGVSGNPLRYLTTPIPGV